MAIELLAAGLGTALSLFGESERVKEEKRRLRAQRRALEEAKITPDEQEAILSGINRQFNTRDLGEVNRAAYGLSSVLNADVVRGLNASRLLGERVSTLEDTKNTIRERNKEIQSQIALTYGESPSINIGNVAAGGILGYQIGESIDKLSADKLSTTELTKKEMPNVMKGINIGSTSREDPNLIDPDTLLPEETKAKMSSNTFKEKPEIDTQFMLNVDMGIPGDPVGEFGDWANEFFKSKKEKKEITELLTDEKLNKLINGQYNKKFQFRF